MILLKLHGVAMTNTNAQKRKDLVAKMFVKPVSKSELLKRSEQQKETVQATQHRSSGPVQAMSKSLTNIEETNKHLKELIASGQQIIELEPERLEASFVRDRMTIEHDPAFETLKDSIATNGQQVPILVREHPTIATRYQVAYGHRRWLACRDLGKAVRAFILPLNDEQLLIAQGQENHERHDLSYLETALFCLRLSQDFPQTTICKAIGKSKSAVSLYLKLARILPPYEILERIGPAPEIGRPRWEEFAELWQQPQASEAVTRFLASAGNDQFEALSSDERFKEVLSVAKRALAGKRAVSDERTPIGPNKAVYRKQTDQKLTFEVSIKQHPQLAEYLNKHMASLVEQFYEERKMDGS